MRRLARRLFHRFAEANRASASICYGAALLATLNGHSDKAAEFKRGAESHVHAAARWERWAGMVSP